MRRRNGTTPVAGSPEAAHRGTTWDHRAADLCMNHVLTSRRQTEPTLTDEAFGQEDILFLETRRTGTEGMHGDGRRPSQRHYTFWYLSVRLSHLSPPAVGSDMTDKQPRVLVTSRGGPLALQHLWSDRCAPTVRTLVLPVDKHKQNNKPLMTRCQRLQPHPLCMSCSSVPGVHDAP